MTPPVAVIAYNRPAYLDECLRSLSGQTEYSNVTVFIDGPVGELTKECQRISDKYGCYHRQLANNVGSPGQWFDALDAAYHGGQDCVTVLSDDVVAGPLFVEATVDMLSVYTQPEIMMVSPFPDKDQAAWPPMPWQVGCHILGVTVKMGAWGKMRDDYMLWMRGGLKLPVADFGPSPNRGEDVAVYTIAASLGMTGIYSQTRHAKYIGVEGCGGNKALYDKQGWANLQIDDHFDHPPMNDWWLRLAIQKMQKEYGKPIRT